MTDARMTQPVTNRRVGFCAPICASPAHDMVMINTPTVNLRPIVCADSAADGFLTAPLLTANRRVRDPGLLLPEPRNIGLSRSYVFQGFFFPLAFPPFFS